MTEINSLHPANQIPTERASLVSRPETDGMERGRAADMPQREQHGIKFNSLVWQSLIFPLTNVDFHTSTVVTVGLCSIPSQEGTHA